MPDQARAAEWEPVLGAADAEEALAVARDVAERLRDPVRVESVVEAALTQTRHPRSLRWRPEGLWQGYAGMAVLWAAADAGLPGEGWDEVGHEHLSLAVAGAERRRHPTAGLSSGLGGLTLATWLLARGGARYRRLLASLEAALAPMVMAATTAVVREQPHGVSPSTFDVISGLSGVGRSLLLRADDGPSREALLAVLRALVFLSQDTDGVPHWHTPPGLLTGDPAPRSYPGGNVNCGLAHGCPGPLALLSSAAARGVVVDGQIEAIRSTAGWLVRHRIGDRWGTNWPAAVPLGAGAGAGPPSRTAWCYGSPGVARALWMAGRAVDDAGYCDIAVEAMEAVYRRPLSARRIDSPTFCHGVAGLLQVTLRFANESGLPLFRDAAQALHRQLVDAFEPESAVGYRSLEPGGIRVDQPGLLDGAAGVAAVLLASATPVEPIWDAVFLLS